MSMSDVAVDVEYRPNSHVLTYKTDTLGDSGFIQAVDSRQFKCLKLLMAFKRGWPAKASIRLFPFLITNH